MADPVLNASLLELEEQRKAVVQARLVVWYLIGAAVVIGVISVFSKMFMTPGLAITGTLLFASVVQFYRSDDRIRDYTREYKEKVVAVAINRVAPKLKFDPNDGLYLKEFVSSGLFDREPDRISSEDQITGYIGNTFFCFSEVHAEYETTTHSKQGTQHHWHDIFKGVIFTADFNKHLNGFTVVRPRDTGNAVGAWLAKNVPLLTASADELVQLENPIFCEQFVTYSTDQVEARYILTPSMMERICELNERCSYTLSASFSGQYMYLAFPLDNDYFEAPLFKSLLNSKSLQLDIELVRFMEGIIEDLDLNTRIWGK